LRHSDAFDAQLRQYGFVVDQITQNGKRFLLCGFARQSDGVPNSKTHAQMVGSDNFHLSAW
jgi:hypothetical protein